MEKKKEAAKSIDQQKHLMSSNGANGERNIAMQKAISNAYVSAYFL